MKKRRWKVSGRVMINVHVDKNIVDMMINTVDTMINIVDMMINTRNYDQQDGEEKREIVSIA